MTIRILIIEDSERDTKLMVHELRKSFDALEHKRIETAESLIRELREGHWDLILSDYSMPSFTGLDALNILEKSGLDIPFILISGTIGENIAVEVMKAGARDYIMKDHLERLVPAIKREMEEAESRKEQKNAEAALIKSEKALKRAQHVAKIGSWWYDPVTQTAKWTEEMFHVFGMKPQPQTPNYEEYKKIIHPDDWERFDSSVSKAVNEGIGYNLELRVTYPNGEIGYVNAICQPTKNEEGIVTELVGTTQDITERKSAEKEIIESENRYHSLFQNMLNGFALCKMIFDEEKKPVDFIYLEVNETFERIIGLKSEDVVGKLVTEAIPGIREAHSELFEIYGRVALTGKEARFEIFFTPLNIWLDITVYSPLQDHFVAIFEDITKRKTAEEELYQYKHIVSSSTEMMALVNKDFIYLAANPAYLNAFKKTSKEIIGFCSCDVFGKEFFETIIKPNAERCLAGEEVNYQDWFELPSKGRRYMDITYDPYVDINKSVEGLVVTARDITKNKYFEDSSKKLRNAIEQAGEMIIITDTNGIIEYSNPAVKKNTGFSSDYLFGKTPHVFYSGIQNKAFYEDMWRTIQSGKIWKGTLKNKKESGEIYDEEMTISPVFDKDQNITNYVAIKRDISNEIKMQQQLIYSEKLSTVGTFVSGVAHELNNPLTAIVGFSEMLMEEEGHSEDTKRKLKMIYEQSERTVDIVKNLLSFSRKSQKEKTFININDAVTKVLKLYSYRLQSDNVELEFIPSKKIPSVCGLENELEQVFMNIITNGHQAMLKQEKRTLKIHVEVRDNSVSIKIENNGPIISPQHLKELFDPFFTTKEPGEGTGLGLYICHQIIEQHEGKIFLENIGKSGVRFTITLPTGKDKSTVLIEEKKGVILEGLQILIIDDEESIREYFVDLLTKERCFCRSVPNATEAMQILQETTFDVILSDVKMPGVSGLEFGEWLSKENPAMMSRFFLVTGLINANVEAFSKKHKCHLLRKPLRKQKLLEEINAAMESN